MFCTSAKTVRRSRAQSIPSLDDKAAIDSRWLVRQEVAALDTRKRTAEKRTKDTARACNVAAEPLAHCITGVFPLNCIRSAAQPALRRPPV
jgi:hypothetical protein